MTEVIIQDYILVLFERQLKIQKKKIDSKV